MICDREHCTGCLACINICKKKAIELETDKFGFVYPKINEDKCVKCGMCRKVCPELNNVNKNTSEMIYAVFAKDKNIHKNSTSGGLATIISKKLIESGGVAYGHGFNENFHLECMRITDCNELDKISGTKYIQSNMNDSILKMKKDLKSGIKIVFIGTPCQVAGVLNVLGEDSDNLYTVSFVCGGVPSQKFFKENIRQELHNINKIKFRNNNKYGFFLYNNNILVKEFDRWKNEFFIGFDEHVIQRECCYNCRYANKSRCGDLTIGDFWGIDNTAFNQGDLKTGISLAIPTTKKGRELLEMCSDSIFIEKHSLSEALSDNPRLNSPISKKQYVYKFRELYIKYGFNKSIRKLFGIKYRIYIFKSKLKKIRFLDYIYHKFSRRK